MEEKNHEFITTSMPSAWNFLNLLGQRFGRAVVTRFAGIARQGKGQVSLWEITCDCGKTKTVASGHLRSGHTASCGCFHVQATGDRARTHGWSSKPGFSNWRAMIDRCIRPEATGYKNYGGRGIVVCDEWMDDFDAFMKEIGPYPGKKYTIERINVNGNYEPGNVRWATQLEQTHNMRKNVFVDFRGERLCVAELARRFGICRTVLGSRLARGMTPEQAVTVPRTRGRPRIVVEPVSA